MGVFRLPQVAIVLAAVFGATSFASATAPEQRANLIVSRLAVSAKSTGAATIAYTVRNSGKRSVRATRLRLWSVDSPTATTGTVLATVSVKKMRAGGRRGGTLALDSLTAGYVRACADAARKVRERSETDNCLTTTERLGKVPGMTPAARRPRRRQTRRPQPRPSQPRRRLRIQRPNDPGPDDPNHAGPNDPDDPTPPTTPDPTTPTTPPTTPGGRVVALLDPGDGATQAIPYLDNPQVDGVAYRALWSQLEPTEDGTLNTAALSGILAAADARGKTVTVHVGVTGQARPSWLNAKGLPTFSASTPIGTVTEIIPWNATYLGDYASLMQRLGTAIATSPALGHVSVGAPISEMTILGCAGGQLGTAPNQTPYSTSSYLSAWTQTVDAVESAFPSTSRLVSLPLSFLCQGEASTAGATFAEDLQATFAPGTGWFAADLKAPTSTPGDTGSARTAQLPSGGTVGYQAIWYVTGATNDRVQGTITQMACAGWNHGGRYVELYKQDLSSGSADLQTALAAAHSGAGCSG